MLPRVAVLALAVVCAFPAGGADRLAPEQQRLNLESFEHVWTTVRDKHWDPKLGGLDWQAVHDELRPQLERAATREQARAVMEDMLSRLKQTHFGIVPAEVYQEIESGGEKRRHSRLGDRSRGRQAARRQPAQDRPELPRFDAPRPDAGTRRE
jgi:hypothetical protein